MANVSKINFNGETLDIKDTHAREQILHLTADNYTADVTGDYTVNAGDISMSSKNTTMHTTADREIDTDGNDSVHIDGASTLNVGGLRTETFAADKTESVTGTTTEQFNNINTAVKGKWMVKTPTKNFSMADVALQADVNTLSNKIDTLTDTVDGRAILTFSDSYDTAIDNVNGWSPSLAALLKASHHYKYGASGMGFVPTTNNFGNELDKAIREIPDAEKDEIKYIVVGGGANDLSLSLSDVQTTIKAFVSNAKSAFKNAKIYIAFIANGVNTKITDAAWINRMTPYNIYLMENFYRTSTIDAGACYAPAYYWATNETFNADFIHPNINGKYNIAKAIYAGIIGNVFFADSQGYLKNNTHVKPYFTHRGGTVVIDFSSFDIATSIDFTGDPKKDFRIDTIVFPMLALTMMVASNTFYCNCTLNDAYTGIVINITIDRGDLTGRAGLVANNMFVTGSLTVIRGCGWFITHTS